MTHSPHRAAVRRAPRLLAALALGAAFVVVGGAVGLDAVAASAAAPVSATVSSAVSRPGASALPTADAAAGPSWSVAPVPASDGSPRPNFDYSADPGEVIDDAIQITNTGAITLDLDVYAADAFTTREGNIDLLAAGEKSVDGGSWIAVAQPSVVLDPGQSATVPFAVTVPLGAKPGDHPAGVVASLSTGGDATVQVDRRLGSRVQLRVSGAVEPAIALGEPRLDFGGALNPLALGDATVTYTVKNTGNVRVTAGALVTLGGPLGLGATSTADQLPEILPGSQIEVRRTVTGVAALFVLTAEVRLAPESVGIGATVLPAITRSATVAAVPVIPLAVLLLAAAAVVFVVLRLRRRRAAAATPAPAPAPVLGEGAGDADSGASPDTDTDTGAEAKEPAVTRG
ncbi:hypothetical protein GCM10027515_05100 [Schumannella luteola]|uniref:DUF916 domain-containing protein n=1 Tax=Schumannella luteola TaxID=472059 RepID=A0A852Y7M9_9MICO|nr:DUF916 domain-containing protein [Schumannella luteola]NYG98353.1 hypothetical protein [Schumannella luteola]TPX05774.1 DUF916 domain-containing protein [Schumannella luteola]